ncbi:hypothetical protein ABW21_db0206764 [Orbilia brochopaga]|nr:hypothetical protein ABW21_db0206764 [Drechslerella brochopaga]
MLLQTLQHEQKQHKHKHRRRRKLPDCFFSCLPPFHRLISCFPETLGSLKDTSAAVPPDLLQGACRERSKIASYIRPFMLKKKAVGERIARDKQSSLHAARLCQKKENLYKNEGKNPKRTRPSCT